MTYIAQAAAEALAKEQADRAAAVAELRADLEAHALTVLDGPAWHGSDPASLHVADVQPGAGLVVFTDGHDHLAVTDTLGAPTVWLVTADPDGPDPATGEDRWVRVAQVGSLAALGEALAARTQAPTTTEEGDTA